MTNNIVEGSFRDPSGFLFWRSGELYRQINITYKEDYDALMKSGLYDELVEEGLLVPHSEVDVDNNGAYKIIKPELIKFISYPYEWCFSQYKDAALCTLKIQKIAIKYGMSLKDSSTYNIQFKDGKAIFIDTLSFEKYKEGQPWVAYRQFCQHFLAPLALMSYKDIRLGQLMRVFIDGIPLDLASSLLPSSTKFKFSLFTNIHLHAKTQKSYSDKAVDTKQYKMNKTNFMALIDSLENAANKLEWKISDTEWGDYYNNTNYTDKAFLCKKSLVEEYLKDTNTNSVWDLGANTGIFSRIASGQGINTIAFDIDPLAVEKNYLQISMNDEKDILPLILDLTNPSPSIGWANSERDGLMKRKLPDTVFALALIHHLAISNNLPFYKIADFFKYICRYLIIEFVPKSDSQVQKLLSTREDIFDNYDQESFEKEFSKLFTIKKCNRIEGTERTLYLMEVNG